jgi:hypothetical protein
VYQKPGSMTEIISVRKWFGGLIAITIDHDHVLLKIYPMLQYLESSAVCAATLSLIPRIDVS